MEPLPSVNLPPVPLHRDRNIATTLAAIIGFFIVWAVTLTFRQREFDWPDTRTTILLLVFAAPLAVVSAILGRTALIDALLWTLRRPAIGGDASSAVISLRLAAAFSLGFGLLGTLIGLVALLTTLDHPRQLGPGVANTLLSQLEGLVMAAVYLAAAAHVAHRHGQIALLAPLARRAAAVAGVIVIAGTLITLAAFFILRLAICPAL